MVRVKPLPAAADYEAYAFAYFAGESTDDGEKIYFGASKGNDPLDYDELNDGKPVLVVAVRHQGPARPVHHPLAEGDSSTCSPPTSRPTRPSTSARRRRPAASTSRSGSPPTWCTGRTSATSRCPRTSPATPGRRRRSTTRTPVSTSSTGRPRSTRRPTTAGRDINTSYQRMMYATTRDFVTFSEPKPWIDVKRGTGRGMIDATVVKDGDTFYRVVKDEASMTPRQEKSTDLRATGHRLAADHHLHPRLAAGQGAGRRRPAQPVGRHVHQGEGPTVFRDNDDPDRWYMFIDQPSYHGGQGYLAFQTDDIASGDWTSVPGADLPSSPRHGTVIPVTQAELDAHARGLPARPAHRVRRGRRPPPPGRAPRRCCPTTVAGRASVTARPAASRCEWDDVDPASYAALGTFEVDGTVVRGSADHPVATVTVTDAADPVVTPDRRRRRTARPAGGSPTRSTVTATATDATGVESVRRRGRRRTVGHHRRLTPRRRGVRRRHATPSRPGPPTRPATARRVRATELRIDATDPVSRATYDAGRASDGASRRRDLRGGPDRDPDRRRRLDDVHRSARRSASAAATVHTAPWTWPGTSRTPTRWSSLPRTPTWRPARWWRCCPRTRPPTAPRSP